LVAQYKTVTDVESFNTVFSALSKRISKVINEIKDSSDRAALLVQEIKIDVFENENLSEYWAYKYEMLDELGVL